MKATISLMNELCACPKMVMHLQDLRDLALRPCSLYFQEDSKIRDRVLKRRVKQITIVAVLLAQKMGILTVVSGHNFHNQRYHVIKHPGSLFASSTN